jgi:hypothetical protein
LQDRINIIGTIAMRVETEFRETLKKQKLGQALSLAFSIACSVTLDWRPRIQLFTFDVRCFCFDLGFLLDVVSKPLRWLLVQNGCLNSTSAA